jgi:hypothetical protein
MIETRLKRARRLLRVQEDLKRLEETRVAVLQQRQSEIASEQENLVSTLSRDEGPQAFLTATIVRRLKRLGEEATRNGAELEQRTDEMKKHAGRAKWAQRRLEDYEQQATRARAKTELVNLIERIAGAGDRAQDHGKDGPDGGVGS